MFKQITVVALVLGCVSANSTQRMLSSDDYDVLARAWYTANYCGRSGMLSPQNAAMSIANVRSVLGQTNVRDDLFKQRVEAFANSGTTVTQEDCNAIAITAAEAQQREQSIQRQAPAQAPAYTSPKTTNCYTVYDWTHCNTF